jgi:hypothetical protein
MDQRVVIAIAAVVGFGLLRAWARRRVIGGAGWALWIAFGLPLAASAAVIWAGVTSIGNSVVLGLVLLGVGVAMFLVNASAVRNMSLAVSPSATADQNASRLLDSFLASMSRCYVVWAFVLLIGGLIAVAAIVAVGVMSR